MSTIPYSKTFSASLDELAPIRDFLENIGKSAGLDDKKIYRINLAVDEIVTNIINHGYNKAGIVDGSINITVKKESNLLKVVIEDKATPFNPLKAEAPGAEKISLPLEERPIGGLGIMLAKQNVDEFIYKYENGKNKNILSINIK